MFRNDRDSWTTRPALRSADEIDRRSALQNSETDGASEESRHGIASRMESDNHTEVPLEAVRVANDIYRNVQRNPESARAAALQLVNLLSPSPAHARGGLAPWQKRKVHEYVREHLQGHIQVADLANEIPLSVSYFYRAFKETFGETPSTYITRRRLEIAQELMSRTEESLTQIALAAGFADQSHLSKAFRRVMAETPSAWRRRNFNRVDASAQESSRRALR